VIRQKRANLIIRVRIGKIFKKKAQIPVRIVAAVFRRLNDAVQYAACSRAARRTRKKPVFSSHGERPNRILRRVVGKLCYLGAIHAAIMRDIIFFARFFSLTRENMLFFCAHARNLSREAATQILPCELPALLRYPSAREISLPQAAFTICKIRCGHNTAP